MKFITKIITVMILMTSSMLLYAYTEDLWYWDTFPPDPPGYAVEGRYLPDEHIVIPEVPPWSDSGRKVVMIAEDGFKWQDQILSVTMPNTIQILGKNAFAGLEYLTRINLPDSITEIRDWAMAGMPLLGDLRLPESLRIIGDYAFWWWGAVDVVIPNNVISVGNSAFWDMENLRSVVIGSSVETLGHGTFVMQGVFEESKQLSEVTFLGNSLRRIGERVFAGTAIRNIVIPHGVTHIELCAFAHCHDLESIILPETLIHLGCEVFRNASLKSIILPLSLEDVCCAPFVGNHDIHIYAAATNRPEGWDREQWNIINFNDDEAPVIWGYVSGCSKPGNFDAVYEDEAVVLTWTTPDIVALSVLKGFYIEKSVGGGPWFTLTQPAEDVTSFIDEHVTLGLFYDYRIRARYLIPEYMTHSTDEIRVTPHVVNAPSDVMAAAEGRVVTISWKAPDSIVGLSGYRVLRNDGLLTYPYITGLTFEDTNVPSGVHVYSVKAVYAASSLSTAIEAEAVFVGFNPPADLITKDGVYSVNLAWSEPDDLQDTVTIDSYRIDRRLIGTDEWVKLADELPLTPMTYNDTYNITAWQVYEYRIIANYIEPVFSSIGSNIENAMPFDLPKPNNFVAVEGVGVANLSWEAPTLNPLAPNPSPLTIVGYNIYRDDTFLIMTTNYYYTDNDIVGTEYTYHITALYHHSILDENFESEATNPQSVVSDNDIVQNIQTNLTGNFPNPFNPVTTIRFSIENVGNVNINVYNVRGQHVRTLVNGVYSAGSHSVVWNGTDDSGRSVGSGIYFYRMTTGDYSAVRRMMLLK
jgi:hypothetical protein